MLDLREEKRTRRKVWMSVLVAILAAVGIGLVVGQAYLASQWESEPPPSRDLRNVDGEIGEGCKLFAESRVTPEVEVLARPELGAMVRGTIANGTELDVVSVRRDYVEVRRAGEIVWIERRHVRQECP